MIKKMLLMISLLGISTSSFAAISTTLSNPLLAQTPPMGWNSWNHFGLGIDDTTVRAQADAMVANGMRDAGYLYINIDDGWEGERDAQGVLHPNSKFPDMKALADYVHSKGLKLGIYSSPGPKTCGGYEGSYGHETQDAKMFAEWGIDYLKYDLCSYYQIIINTADTEEEARQLMHNAYTKMHQALLNTHRPIVFSLCQYGIDDVWQWGAAVGGNLWRTTGDIEDNYKRMTDIGFGQAGLATYAEPGHWNDPDMLEVGNGGMTTEEYRTHMSLWALLAAPLLTGNDLNHMSQDTQSILLNPEVIAIDQDKAGKQGDRIRADETMEIWARPLADSSQAVGLFNLTTAPKEMVFYSNEIGFKDAVKVRDVWQHQDKGTINKEYRVMVPAHGVVLLRVHSAN